MWPLLIKINESTPFVEEFVSAKTATSALNKLKKKYKGINIELISYIDLSPRCK